MAACHFSSRSCSITVRRRNGVCSIFSEISVGSTYGKSVIESKRKANVRQRKSSVHITERSKREGNSVSNAPADNV